MGKKEKYREEEATQPSQPIGPLASLFSAQNPFRRKPDQSITSPTTPPPDVASKLSGLDLSFHGDAEESRDARKRKKKTNGFVTEEGSDEKKRKGEKMEVVDEGKEKPMGSQRKKRKRREIEEEYEMWHFGQGGDEMEEYGEEERDEVGVGRKRKAEEVEGGKDMVVRKEEMMYDDENKLLRTVFVGNLPLRTKRKILLKEFANFGEIESIRIRSVPLAETKEPRITAVIKGKVNDTVDRVHAYIVFKDEQSAQAALCHNMAKIGENHIRVDKACPPRKKMKGEAPIYSVKKTVFIGNLPYDVKDEEIYQLFCEDGQLGSSMEAVRVIRDPYSGQGKGIAYVLFKTREAANKLVKKELRLRDRTLRLSHARHDAVASKVSTPLKRKYPASGKDDHNKRATNLSEQMDSNPKVKADTLSYQGLRSSKSGVHKKLPKGTERLNSLAKGKTPPTREKKVRSTKRPAVAARKAKALKRKLDDGTSEMPHRKKKSRHFK